VGPEFEQLGVNQEAEGREETGRSTEALEPNSEIQQPRQASSRLMERPNLSSTVASLDSAYGTQTVWKRGRLFEPDGTAISPTESTPQTSKYMTPTECCSVPKTPKKIRTGSEDESEHRSSDSEVTACARQHGGRVRAEEVVNSSYVESRPIRHKQGVNERPN